MVLVATLLDCDMILWIVEDKLPSEVTIVFQEKFRLVTNLKKLHSKGFQFKLLENWLQERERLLYNWTRLQAE